MVSDDIEIERLARSLCAAHGFDPAAIEEKLR